MSVPDFLAGLLRSRRTVHEFRRDPPPRELLLEGIDLARWAPNHHRTEPWHFYLIGRPAVARIAELNADLVRRAKGEQAARAKLERWLAIPGWFALTCRHSADARREREDYAACCCAVQNLMLYLWGHGLGVKWTTGEVTRDRGFLEILGIDAAEEFVVGLFWYGYPVVVPNQTRKPLEAIVTEVGSRDGGAKKS